MIGLDLDDVKNLVSALDQCYEVVVRVLQAFYFYKHKPSIVLRIE